MQIRHIVYRVIPAFIAFLLSVPVHAEWVQVTGSAHVKQGLYEQARLQAREDALQKAVMRFGANIHSQQEMQYGELTKDELSIEGHARVRRSEIQEEYLANGNLHVVLNVLMDQIQACTGSQSSQYRKSVAIMGFSLQSPEQASMGALHNVDQGLSQALGLALQQQDGLIIYRGLDTRLYANTLAAPTHYTQQLKMSNAVDLARQLGSQFVVSGVVRDLSVEDESAFERSAWKQLLRAGNLSNVTRNFEVELFVHDGFSGSIIWQRTFTAHADWTLPASQKVGFGSGEFWQVPYGKEVKKLINTMAYLIDEQLKCQPFLTRISRIDGKTLHFDSGSSTGIRPGDKFALYRTYHFEDAQRFSGVELKNVKTALTVSQVHPEFGSGTIAIEPGRINIQEDDVLIAW